MWAMAKTKPLIIIANAYEHERQFKQGGRIMWTRAELSELMRVYGREVANGNWRDYALGDGHEAAYFSIFRRTSEVPLYNIAKIPALRRKQGQYILHGMDGRILRRGHNLTHLMRFFTHRKLRLVN